MKNPWTIIGIITVLLFVGAIIFSNIANEKNNEGVKVSENTRGNVSAIVSLVEYSDFQCPACAAFHPVLQGVLDEYSDQISFEYKHFPLPAHTYANQAAVAAEAAGQQGKFFEFQELLFENQTTWSVSPAPIVFFTQYAEELGIDVDTFRRHMNSSILRDKVRTDLSDGRALGINSTPTFLLNGQRMQFESYQEFVSQVAYAIDPSYASSTESSTGTSSSSTSSGVIFGI